MDKDTFIETLKEIPLEENNCVSTYGSVDVRELLTTIDRFSQVPNYETLLKENHTLNKGIDETIEEIEFEINNNFVVGGTYNRLNCLLQYLKKLKGSE